MLTLKVMLIVHIHEGIDFLKLTLQPTTPNRTYRVPRHVRCHMHGHFWILDSCQGTIRRARVRGWGKVS